MLILPKIYRLGQIIINTVQGKRMDKYDNDKLTFKSKQQLDAFGTPMIVKTPIDFKARMDEQKKTN